MYIEKKKGAVDLTDLALGIIVLGIVVSIGAYMLTTYRDARLTDLSTVTTSNETGTITDSGLVLTNTWVKSVDLIQNGTGTLPAANYSTTISPVFGTATIRPASAASGANNSLVNVSYTWYNTSRQDWSLANKASAGLLEYGNWFKIIVIVGVAAVVLSLIFMAFGKGSTGTEVSY